MAKYERIRADGKTLYLEDTREITFLDKLCLKGLLINRNGECIWTKKGALTEHIISMDLITKRTEMFFNGRYGELQTEPWTPQ